MMHVYLSPHLDDAVGRPAAPVHRDAGRLVQHQQVLVLVHDRGGEQFPERLAGAPDRGRTGLGAADGGKADAVAGGDPLVGLRAFAVDPDLTLAKQPIDVGPGHTLQDSEQEIVEALAVVALTRFDVLHAATGGGAVGIRLSVLVSH